MARVPVVRIKAENEDGYMLINASDFDENEHNLFVNKPLKKTPKQPNGAAK